MWEINLNASNILKDVMASIMYNVQNLHINIHSSGNREVHVFLKKNYAILVSFLIKRNPQNAFHKSHKFKFETYPEKQILKLSNLVLIQCNFNKQMAYSSQTVA